MAKGDLLKFIYDDSNVTFYSEFGRVYSKVVTDRKGEEYVEYRNIHDELIGIAREIGFADGSRRVLFTDHVDNLLAYAEIAHGLIGGQFIAFYRAGNAVDIQEARYLTWEEYKYLTRKDPEPVKQRKDPPPTGKGCLTAGFGWVLIIAAILVCGIFATLLTENFAHLQTYAYDVLEVVKFIATRLSCVIAAVLCLIFLRLPKGTPKGAVVFWALLALLTVVPFWFVGIQLDRMLQPYGLGIQGWDNVKFFLLSFVPGFAHCVAVWFVLLFVKKSPNRSLFRELAHKAGRIYVILSGILIFVSRMAAAYTWQFEADFSNGMFFVFRMVWYGLLVAGINSFLLVCIKEN